MEGALRHLVFCVLDLAAGYRAGPQGLRILMYHRVNDLLPPGELVVSARRFREQMRYLKERCDVVGLLRWADPAFRETVFRRKPLRPLVALTFDDGYRDNFLHAFPVLKELALPATIFLITSCVGTDRTRPRYEHLSPPDMLNWDEAAEMARGGISFGAHTATHPHFDGLTDEEQGREIAESVSALQDHLVAWEGAVRMFSYPYGEYGATTFARLQEMNFSLAVTLEPGVNDPSTDLFRLRRTEISGLDTLVDFRKKLCGVYDRQAAFRPPEMPA